MKLHILQALGWVIVGCLTELFKQIMEGGEIKKDWAEIMVILFHKGQIS